MSNYTKTTDFAAKDALLTGNPSKLVKGTEINTEFSNIQTAVNSKLDSSGVTTFAATVLDDADAATARATLGAAASGANTDITSLGALTTISGTPNFSGAATGITATLGDNTTKLATTAYVKAASTTGTASNVTGVVAIANGGTGQSTAANAMIALGGSLGVGQTWQNLTGSRVPGTTYTNSTGQTIAVQILETSGSLGTGGILAFMNGADVGGGMGTFPGAGWPVSVVLIVPNGGTYGYNRLGAFSSLSRWSELR